MYAVIVTLHIKPDRIDDFLRVTAANVAGSRQEPGNLRFDVLAVDGKPGEFRYYECYVDAEAFTAHQQTPHYQTWKAAVEDLQAERRHGERGTVVLH
jgi:autoinducer 2-degrading protein